MQRDQAIKEIERAMRAFRSDPHDGHVIDRSIHLYERIKPEFPEIQEFCTLFLNTCNRGFSPSEIRPFYDALKHLFDGETLQFLREHDVWHDEQRDGDDQRTHKEPSSMMYYPKGDDMWKAFNFQGVVHPDRRLIHRRKTDRDSNHSKTEENT